MTGFLPKKRRALFTLAIGSLLIHSFAFAQLKNEDPTDKKHSSSGGKHEINPHGTPNAYEKSVYKPKKLPPKQSQYAKSMAYQKIKRLPKDILNNCAMLMYKGRPRDWIKDIPVFDLLKMRSSRMEPTVENSLSFANLEKSYEEVCQGSSNYHCCWGHTTVTRKFSALAFFDRENIAGDIVPDRVKDPMAWAEFYHKKIDKILNYEAVTIPGFSNTYEFSSVPEMQVYIKQKVMHEWAENAIKIHVSALRIFLSNRYALFESELDRLLVKLEAELAKGYNPKIFFTAANSSVKADDGKAIHVVQVTRIERDLVKNDGTAKIWLWDISNPADQTQTYIRVEGDGRAFYDKWADIDPTKDEAKLSEIDLTPENADDIARIGIGLFKFAQEKPALFDLLK